MAELKARVNRDLRLEDPVMEGPDVKALQVSLNEILAEFPKIAGFGRLKKDGKLGDKTLFGALRCATVMGLPESRLQEIEKKHLIEMRVQRLLHRPSARTDSQRKRAVERRKELRKQLKRRPKLKDVNLTTTFGPPHWGGSGDVMTEFVEPFMVKRGLFLGSGKRTPAKNAAVGGSTTSHHLTTRTTAAARDFPTFTGEDDARALARALGFASWQPNNEAGFTFSAGGSQFSAQVLWGSLIKHGDHVHVGIVAL
jgi:hypothetical protein